jgi:hypothetical protein
MSASKFCTCRQNYAYQYGICTLCPNNSQASSDQSRCICQQGLIFSISEWNCSRCPRNSYPAGDGMSCLCNSGYVSFNGECVSSNNCSANQIKSGDICICQYGFAFHNGVCTKCPADSTTNLDQTKCICPFQQYFNPISFTCVKCPSNSYTTKDGFSCKCNNGYTNSSGNCVSEKSCGVNQLMIDGKCQCFDGYAYYYGVCTQCTGNSYPNTDQSKCMCPPLQMFAWRSFTCIDCPAHSYPSTDLLSCLCNSGYISVNGSCVPFSKCG